MSEQLLEIKNLVVRYGGTPRWQDRHPRRIARHPGRRDGEPGGRVRIGQDDDRPRHPRPRARHGRHDHLPRSGDQQHLSRTATASRTRHPGHLPGPVLVSQSVDDGGEHPRRTAPRRRSDRGPRACAGTAGCRRPAGRRGVALPARILRRSAAAHRHRARSGAGPCGHRVRRADQRPRRHDAGARSRTSRGPAEGHRRRLPLHQPRPRRRARDQRPHRRPEGRQHRGDRRRTPSRNGTHPPVHPQTADVRARSPTHHASARAGQRGCRRSPPRLRTASPSA